MSKGLFIFMLLATLTNAFFKSQKDAAAARSMCHSGTKVTTEDECQDKLKSATAYKHLCSLDSHEDHESGCMWDASGKAVLDGIVIPMFVLWGLIIIGYALKNFVPAKIHSLVWCPLHIVNTGEKEVELQKKFLDCEPDIVPGDFKKSFWRFYKCTDPIFGAIFCEKSHFSSRLNKAIVVFFIFTYGLYLQMILAEEPWVVTFFVITVPNALFWGPLMDYANLKSIKAAIKGTTGCWLNFWNCFDRIKNIFMFCLCLGFFILTEIKLAEEIPLPVEYLLSYLFNGVIFPMAFNLIQTLILFKLSWDLVEDPEHRPCWKTTVLALNGFLPASVSGYSILDTPGAKDKLEMDEKKDIELGAGTPGTEKALEPEKVPGKRSAETTAGTPKEGDQDDLSDFEEVPVNLEKDSSHGDLTE